MSEAPAPRPRRRRNDPGPLADPILPPGPSTIDLHAHTRRSDGMLEPAELIRAAADCGVTTFALTDHDTIAGHRDIVAAGAIPAGIELITGVEINAIVREEIGLWEGELHILGFGMDPDDEAFEAVLIAQRDQRRLRFARSVDRLRDLGLPIDAQVATLDPRNDDALGRPTIARMLTAAGFAVSVEDAFRRLIGRGAPAYIRRHGLGPHEAILAIRAAGGLPVLAHFSEAPGRRALLRELIDRGLAGLEVFYRAFARPTVESMAEVARSLGLLATGGTDYHGDTGTYAEAHAALWVPPQVADGVRGAGVVGSFRRP